MAARKKTSKNAASRGGKERSTGSYAHPEAGALMVVKPLSEAEA